MAIEADALYRRVGTTQYPPETIATAVSILGLGTSPVNFSLPLNRFRGNSWQFPVLGKFYFHIRSWWQPFAGAGYTFRTTSYTVNETLLNISSTGILTTSAATFKYTSDTGVGAAFAAGVRAHFGRFAVLPEFRYTRWGSSDGLNKNEANFLLGVSY